MKEKDNGFVYTVEQFADLQLLRYRVPGFDELSLRQKTLVYYLSQAALEGRDILFDQNGKYNLQIRRLLADRHFLAFILLALLPSALLCVGFLNYFLPVFLKQADVAQSNIGRIYMLNCLIVIYSGPLFARLVGNSLRKGPLLFWAGILSALSVACFCFLPPLPASVAGSILLGLATGLNIPAQSEFLLELDIARAIGVDQAMSLLDALQRVGQVIGPVCVGAVMAIMSVDDAARWAGIILVAISLLFLLLVRPTRHSGDRA